MQVEVNGTRLWFDVDGAALVPDGPIDARAPDGRARPRRTGRLRPLVFQARFGRLTHRRAGGLSGPAGPRPLGPARPERVDLRSLRGRRAGVLRRARHRPADRARPLDGWLHRDAVRRASSGPCRRSRSSSRRWPGSTSPGSSRDSGRVGGDEVAELAGRDYGGDEVSDEEWDLVFAGVRARTCPDAEQLARRIANPAMNGPAWT